MMKPRDKATFRRLMDKYGHQTIIDEMVESFEVSAAHYRSIGDMTGYRWHTRAAKLVPNVFRSTIRSIDGRIVSQPEIDNLARIG